jgi:heat-inducible transcriptional repressor
MLDDRKAAILRVLVEEHVRTGGPVSSRSILEHSSLTCSSATIRNELAVLERDGLIEKPHSSAGRVPTDQAYRYYLDHLSPGSLRRPTRQRIAQFFASIHAELNRLLKETSDFLSDITHYPAVVLGPGLRGATVRDAHLIPVEPGAVLLVLVTDGGRVTQTLLRTPEPIDPSEVSRAQDVLAEALPGRVLSGRDTLDVDELREELPAPAFDLLHSAVDAVSQAAEVRREVFVGGTSHLVSLWEDLAKLHRILALLEREAVVLELLDDEAEDTTVRLGSELAAGEEDLAVVSTRYEIGGAAGRMGVLGPRRMDYRGTIEVIEGVRDALGDQTGG